MAGYSLIRRRFEEIARLRFRRQPPQRQYYFYNTPDDFISACRRLPQHRIHADAFAHDFSHDADGALIRRQRTQ